MLLIRATPFTHVKSESNFHSCIERKIVSENVIYEFTTYKSQNNEGIGYLTSQSTT